MRKINIRTWIIDDKFCYLATSLNVRVTVIYNTSEQNCRMTTFSHSLTLWLRRRTRTSRCLLAVVTLFWVFLITIPSPISKHLTIINVYQVLENNKRWSCSSQLFRAPLFLLATAARRCRAIWQSIQGRPSCLRKTWRAGVAVRYVILPSHGLSASRRLEQLTRNKLKI